jgi:ribosomal protein S18 acetylase RimI-like enzyme
LAACGVHLAQALLPDAAETPARRLLAGGYQLAADLLYLVCDAEEFPDHLSPLPFTLEAVEPDRPARLEPLIRATYAGTLDCPQVDGVREPADVLASYRAAAAFDPRLWLIARDGGQDVGCLLLGDHPQDSQMEIVYLGLIPAVRGRGWGLELTRHAQWLARAASRERMVLAVDAQNSPALGMYATCGFWVGDRRRAFVKDLRGRPSQSDADSLQNHGLGT